MIKTSEIRQYYTIFLANLLTLIFGISVGWPSATLPQLLAPTSPLPVTGQLTLNEASWVSSIICIGGASGTVFFGWLGGRYGRKPALLSAAIPTMSTWVLILAGTTVYHLYVARFLAGFGAGGVFVTVPIYVAEISSNDIRGSLGSLLVLMNNAGIILGYTICSFMDYFRVPWVGISLGVVFLIGFVSVPETPKFLMVKGDFKRAKKSLMYYQGLTDVPIELSGTHCPEFKVGKLRDFGKFHTLKASLIGIIVMTLNCFSGVFTLMNYIETIFKESGASLSPAVSSITVAIIQFFGSYAATLLIEKLGRKFLLLTSSYLCALLLTSIGAFFYLKDHHYNVDSVTWIPVTCFSLLVFIAANGVYPVPFVIVGEIFASEVRPVLLPVSIVTNWVIGFGLVKAFPFLAEALGFSGAIWTFAIICTSLATCLFPLLPETKGKSIEEIISSLGKQT